MAKRRLKMKSLVELRRQNGQSPIDIARYVHRACGPQWSRKIVWTPPERAELEQLDRDFAERKSEKARKFLEAGEEAACKTAALRAALTPAPPTRERCFPNLRRKGLSPTAVRQALGCTATELERWAHDGRLPPDGERFYYHIGPRGGNKWGRAWLSDTIDKAGTHIDEWRKRDAEMRRLWISEGLLFDLVRSRFSDALSQWSPDWLGRQRVDIYVPSINVAFEYQGKQHYEPVAFWGGQEHFRKTHARDAQKRKLLAHQRVSLVEWRYDTPVNRVELDRALLKLKYAEKVDT